MKSETFFSGKNILVTGACGTIGTELVQCLLTEHSPAEVLCVDNNETALFFLEQKFASFQELNTLLCDIRDWDKMDYRMQGIDIVFHTAAFKHVMVCEKSPFEAVQNNILALQKLIQSAIRAKVKYFAFTSSDKAVNPTNVMGTSKLMGERLVTSANAMQRDHKTVFISTRFGNVLGSHGSVVQIFAKQIMKGLPITLTDPAMTRFIMSKRRAVQLVLDSVQLARGGEVFITKMPAIKISDLGQAMIESLAPIFGHAPESIKTQIIGPKPGEKLYEELMTSEEAMRSIELQDYFAVLPAFRGIYNIDYSYNNIVNSKVNNPYHSKIQVAMTKAEINSFLTENNILEEFKIPDGI